MTEKKPLQTQFPVVGTAALRVGSERVDMHLFIDARTAKQWFEDPQRVAAEAQADENQIFEHTWDPRRYLTRFYSEIEPDELVTIKHNVTEIQKEKTRREKLGLSDSPFPVAVVGGWTVKDLIDLAEIATEIHVTDFLESNTKELNKWINKDPDAWNWNKFTRYALQCEKNSENPLSVKITDEEVQAREDLLRSKITRVSYNVDAKKSDPLGEEARGFYPLVRSPFTADSATQYKTVWWRMMDNIMSTVQEGGLFMTAALRNCREYDVDVAPDGTPITFPCANINEDDMTWRLWTAENFQPDSISVTPIKEGLQGHGYDGIILAQVRKSDKVLAA